MISNQINSEESSSLTLDRWSRMLPGKNLEKLNWRGFCIWQNNETQWLALTWTTKNVVTKRVSRAQIVLESLTCVNMSFWPSGPRRRAWGTPKDSMAEFLGRSDEKGKEKGRKTEKGMEGRKGKTRGVGVCDRGRSRAAGGEIDSWRWGGRRPWINYRFIGNGIFELEFFLAFLVGGQCILFVLRREVFLVQRVQLRHAYQHLRPVVVHLRQRVICTYNGYCKEI